MKVHRNLIFLSPLCAILLLSGCKKEEPPPMPPPAVQVVPVSYDYIATASNFIGQAVAYDEVDLVARVEGFLEKRNFEEGSFVKKDTVLFEIEKDYYKAKVDAAQAQLDQDAASLKDANREYDRFKGLLEKNAASKKDFDKAETTKETAAAKELAAKANLELAKLNLNYTEIKAPFDGRISISTYSVGNLVGPSSGKLANIIRKDSIKVDFYVSEKIIADYLTKNIDKDNEDSDIMLSLVLPNGKIYEHKGTLDFNDNKINPNTGTILVRSVFPNPKNIVVPGMYVKVKVEAKNAEKHLYIPVESVQEDQSGKFVIVIGKENKAEKRNVKLNLEENTGGLFVIVKSGLKEGEQVVVDGILKVREGSPVAPTLRNGNGASHSEEKKETPNDK
jgi:membrane fusion protein (multidrug efflux system)